MKQKLYACEHTSGSLAFTTLGAPWKTVSVCRHCLTSTISSATEEKEEQGRESASTIWNKNNFYSIKSRKEKRYERLFFAERSCIEKSSTRRFGGSLSSNWAPNTSTWPSTVATSASTEFMRCCIWFCWRMRFTKKGTWQCTKNEPLILQADRLQLTRLEKARLTPHARSLQRHRMNVLPSVIKTWIPSYKTMVSEGRITMITISMRPARIAALCSIPIFLHWCCLHPLSLLQPALHCLLHVAAEAWGLHAADMPNQLWTILGSKKPIMHCRPQK